MTIDLDPGTPCIGTFCPPAEAPFILKSLLQKASRYKTKFIRGGCGFFFLLTFEAPLQYHRGY